MEKILRWLFRESGTMCGLRPEQQILRGSEMTTALMKDGGFFVDAIPGGNLNRETTYEYKTRNPGPG